MPLKVLIFLKWGNHNTEKGSDVIFHYIACAVYIVYIIYYIYICHHKRYIVDSTLWSANLVPQ